MEKNSLGLIINDLRSKRDALSLCHEELKSNNDDWNKGIIILSLTGGLMESAKMKLELTGAGWGLLPIVISSIIASMSSLIKFRKYPERMEVLIQGISLLTNTLNKCRNHDEVDGDILLDYNMALEKLETSVYPSVRKKYLKQSHKNLIEIMKQEKKYYDAIDDVNSGKDIQTESDISSDDLINYSNSPLQTKRSLPQINEDVENV
tara:strand:- start:4472 stop:5089 length:618 start_codon:yes stop_codon:yes gene_type:complete